MSICSQQLSLWNCLGGKENNGFSGVMWTKVRFHLREKLDRESV